MAYDLSNYYEDNLKNTIFRISGVANYYSDNEKISRMDLSIKKGKKLIDITTNKNNIYSLDAFSLQPLSIENFSSVLIPNQIKFSNYIAFYEQIQENIKFKFYIYLI